MGRTSPGGGHLLGFLVGDVPSVRPSVLRLPPLVCRTQGVSSQSQAEPDASHTTQPKITPIHRRAERFCSALATLPGCLRESWRPGHWRLVAPPRVPFALLPAQLRLRPSPHRGAALRALGLGADEHRRNLPFGDWLRRGGGWTSTHASRFLRAYLRPYLTSPLNNHYTLHATHSAPTSLGSPPRPVQEHSLSCLY